MRPRLESRRLLARRLGQAVASRALPRAVGRRSWASQAPSIKAVMTRPALPFLSAPKAGSSAGRSFTSAQKQWFKHEVKLVLRYTLALWGCGVAVVAIFFAVGEEAAEREFPTPHEWNFLTRKYLRDALKAEGTNWVMALELARNVVIRLEDPNYGGEGVARLSGHEDPTLAVPGEFIPRDISAMPDAWRRGYFQAIMLTAKAAEHADGWLRDHTRDIVSRPEYVTGPSNPRPKPTPPGSPRAPREEDCEPAFPPADSWYMKILATKGFTPRQMMDAALQYASFMEYKGQAAAAEALHDLALAEATQGISPARLPYDPKTLVLNDGVGAPSANVLDSLTAIANFKARSGKVSAALPMYISLLKARRALADAPPAPATSKPEHTTVLQHIVSWVTPPAYPDPPADGTKPPWRSPHERCHEAALHLYIGEILYATSSRVEGLAWTRDGVDMAEEQLRARGPDRAGRDERQTCRDCLATGLDNWSTMVALLARAEEAKAKGSSKPGVLALWSGAQEAEGRWASEEAVVQERVRRTKELLDDVTPPPPKGLLGFFQA